MLNHKPTTRKKSSSDNLRFLEVKQSPIHGKGLFSEVNFEPGIILTELQGEKMTHEYDPCMSAQNPNWLGIGYQLWLKLAPGDEALYINHSCNPNVIVNDKMQLVTIDSIKSGGELFLDYSTTELDPFWTMECSCGQVNCRKVLTAYQFLPRELKVKYARYLPSVFSDIGEEALVDSMQAR